MFSHEAGTVNGARDTRGCAAKPVTLPLAVAAQMRRGAAQIADYGRGVSSFRVGVMCALRQAGSLETGQSVRAPIASARDETASDDRQVSPP